MKKFESLKDSEQDFQLTDLEQGRRPTAIIVAVACLLIAAIAFAGYFIFFRQTAQPLPGQEQRAENAPANLATEANIFEDEPLLRDSKAIVGGKVRNISRESLNDLSLEIELKRRSDGSTETRTIPVEPNDLAPGAEGKYSLTLTRQEFSGIQVKHLKSASRPAYIAFKTSPGARRPKEPPFEPPTRTVTIERPSPRSTGEEFINTPDNPTRVP